jgi:hydrogenase expression/formation protein HypE
MILLGHGSGGLLSHTLIKELFVSNFRNGKPRPLDDAAVFDVNGSRCAFSTDSFVVDPLFFPGGDIGKLAVCGTINDLCMMGARPMYLSLAMIIEEGFPLAELGRIVDSITVTALSAKVEIITGDTKVVAKGSADKLFINTTGFGVIEDGFRLSGALAKDGDKILINGTIGDHGIAVLSQRADLQFETEIQSDCAALNELLDVLRPVAPSIHVLRDPTRGGVATTLNEIAEQSNVGIELDEPTLPIAEGVRAACELIGYDPLYVANEGKMLLFIENRKAEDALAILRAHPLGRNAACIGRVTSSHSAQVVLNTSAGGRRIIDMLAGEQLPRIC